MLLTTILGEVVWKNRKGLVEILGAGVTKFELTTRRADRRNCCDMLGEERRGSLAAVGRGRPSYVLYIQRGREGARDRITTIVTTEH